MGEYAGIVRSRADVPFATVPMKTQGGSLETQQLFGLAGSMMYARRSGGYHSIPHRHDCEQFNYVLEGEIWLFVEDEGYPMSAGDFSRVPKNLVHWAWNNSESDCVILEFHTPALQMLDPSETVLLLSKGEDPRTIQGVPNEWVMDHPVAEVESKVMAGYVAD